MFHSIHDSLPSRREFLGTASCTSLAAGCGLASLASAEEPSVADPSPTELVKDVTRSIVFEGRNGGSSWFHPRACMVEERTEAGERDRYALMTLQSITGSDVFGHVHWSVSRDGGKNWSRPEPIPGLGRRDLKGEMQVGVCDVVPTYHRPTGTVLAIGHNVFYRRGVLARPQPPRWPVYVVRDSGGRWTEPRKLDWDDPRGSQIYSCNCSQRVHLPGGKLLIPLTFGPQGRRHRSVTSTLCRFDGKRVAIEKVGNELVNRKGRGLLEPSLVAWRDEFFVTIRAEDGRGYWSRSGDGLKWEEQRAWTWEDGTPLVMSTTQQHWLPHSAGLFLVYTRKSKQNVNVFRWRAPIYMARFDPARGCLLRETERVVLPLVGDGINDPKHVARMGNFHITSAAPDESWVTVGETLPHDHWQGNLLLARIRWSQPNGLAGG